MVYRFVICCTKFFKVLVENGGKKPNFLKNDDFYVKFDCLMTFFT